MSRLVCFLINTFGKQLLSDTKNGNVIVVRMHALRHTKNDLAAEDESKNWNRKEVPSVTLSSESITDFLELSTDDLDILFTVTSQPRQDVKLMLRKFGISIHAAQFSHCTWLFWIKVTKTVKTSVLHCDVILHSTKPTAQKSPRVDYEILVLFSFLLFNIPGRNYGDPARLRELKKL